MYSGGTGVLSDLHYMAAPLGVTRASAGSEPRRRRASHWRLCGLVILLASAVPGPSSAQTRPPDEAVEAPSTAAAPSAASLARIRRALAFEGLTTPSGLDIVDDGSLVDRRRAIQLLPGLDFVGGLDLFGVIDGPGRQLGPPTHRDMMHVMTARGMNEAVSSDVLGIATVSAFSLGLPYAMKAIKAIGGWLFGHDDDDAPQHPILTESEETRALAGARADSHVLGAGVHQHGRTVVLSLVVPADTPPDTARALGERFVVLVKTFASTEPDPERDVGTGNYDYIVRISSPTEHVIALGGKATSHTTINW